MYVHGNMPVSTYAIYNNLSYTEFIVNIRACVITRGVLETSVENIYSSRANILRFLLNSIISEKETGC